MFPNVKLDYRKINRIRQNSIGWNEHEFLQKKEIEIEQFTSVGDDELLLGASSLDFEDAVTIPFDKRKRITMCIQGDNSTGKSILARNIVFDQLFSRFDRKVIFLDPKLDSHGLAKRNRISAFAERLAKYDILPEAYHAKYISPKALDISGAWGKKSDGLQYSLGMDNFNKIENKGSRLDLLLKVWNTALGEPVGRVVQDLFLSDNPPKTIQELEAAIAKIQKPPPTLEAQLKLFKSTNMLADQGANYPKLLADNGILCIETGLSDPEKSTLADVFVEDAVMSCVQDRTRSVTTANKEGNLHAPFTFYIDEADTFAGKQKETSNLLTFLITKYRELNPEMKSRGIQTYGCDSIIVSQHIHTLAEIIVRECDWIIMPKLTNEKDGDALRARGLDTVDLYDLQQLEFGRTHPKEWVAIDKDRNIIHFFPLPTRSYM